MTDDHLGALLTVAEGKKEKDGWFTLPEGRHITLYVAFNGASLSVSKITHVKRDGGLLVARTVKEESFLLAIADVYAGSVEAPASSGRKAGFV